jgi:membrane-associated phospholipid phosphatase
MSSIVITFLASFLIWFMFAGLFIVWIFRNNIHSEHVMHALIASFTAFLLSQLIKHLFPSLRPFQVNGAIPLTLTIPMDAAFPSSHSATSFAMAMSIQRFDKKIGIVFVGFAILVSLGRVLSNVHNYVDIFGGAIIGVISVILFEDFIEKRLVKYTNIKS